MGDRKHRQQDGGKGNADMQLINTVNFFVSSQEVGASCVSAGWTEHERKGECVRFIRQSKNTKVGFLVPRCNCS